jgi:hypothetical protein
MFPFQKIKLFEALFIRIPLSREAGRLSLILQTPRKGGYGKQKRPQFESCGAFIQKAKQEQQTQEQVSTGISWTQGKSEEGKANWRGNSLRTDEAA